MKKPVGNEVVEDYNLGTHKEDDQFSNVNVAGELNSMYFMCIEKEKLLYLCDIFPQTAENLKRRSKERRKRFMIQRNTNSEHWDKKYPDGKEPAQIYD